MTTSLIKKSSYTTIMKIKQKQIPQLLRNNTQSSITTSIRINKALANAGVCSRRNADKYILNGEVTINGKSITQPGIYIHPDKDIIALHGRRVDIQLKNKKYYYLSMYKPIQVISSVRDPQNRLTVLDFIPLPWKNYRLYPVGRLDFFSEGLLLITNDGELTQRLTHPRYHISKVYHVLIRERVLNTTLKNMSKGIILSDGTKLPPTKVRVLSSITKTNTTWLEITLQQGINRQIRRMCKALGLTILKLIRVKQGNINLSNLQPGEVRLLKNEEVQLLKKNVQLI